MMMLILNPTKQTQLAALNADGEATLQLCAIPLTSGDAALSASLLSDCAAGQTWELYGGFLASLPHSEVSAEEFSEIELT